MEKTDETQPKKRTVADLFDLLGSMHEKLDGIINDKKEQAEEIEDKKDNPSADEDKKEDSKEEKQEESEDKDVDELAQFLDLDS